MALTAKQKKVIDFCLANDNKITKKQAMDIIDTHYYNGDKHVGDCLSRMVKSGLLVRLKPGHFQLVSTAKYNPSIINKNQTNLF